MMRHVGTIEYEDGTAFVCQDMDTGGLAVMLGRGRLLPVQRAQLEAFMVRHGLHLRSTT